MIRIAFYFQCFVFSSRHIPRLGTIMNGKINAALHYMHPMIDFHFFASSYIDLWDFFSFTISSVLYLILIFNSQVMKTTLIMLTPRKPTPKTLLTTASLSTK
jgi:hypothetical protein